MLAGAESQNGQHHHGQQLGLGLHCVAPFELMNQGCLERSAEN
jgi:hypothetical protein